MRWSDGLIVMLLTGVVVACTGAPAASPTRAPAAAAAATAPSLDALYAAAKQEGQLTLYTTLNTQFGQPLIDKFSQRYPGIAVKYNRQQAEQLTQVMQQEAGTGKMGWDVVEGPEDAFFGYIQSKYV